MQASQQASSMVTLPKSMKQKWLPENNNDNKKWEKQSKEKYYLKWNSDFKFLSLVFKVVILVGRLRIKIIKTLHSDKQYVFGSAIGTTHCVVARVVSAFPKLIL